MEKLVLVLLLINSVYSENKFVRNLFYNSSLVEEYENIVEDETLLDKDVCTLTDAEWKGLQEFFIGFLTDKNLVNYDTGSFIYSTMLTVANRKEQVRSFVGGQCDEEYNMQSTMDDKILAVCKSFIKREALCEGIATAEVACKLPPLSEMNK